MLSSALADNALSVYRFLFARLHNGVTELSAMYSCAHVHSSLGLTCVQFGCLFRMSLVKQYLRIFWNF